MKKMSVCMIVFFLGTGTLLAAPELRGSPDEIKSYLQELPGLVEISARGELQVDADYSEVLLTIKNESSRLEESINRVSQMAEQISKTLISKGVDKKDIKLQKFNNTPSYGVFGSKSYKVSNKLKIKIFKPALLREVARIVDGNKEIQYSGVAYKHSKSEAFKKEVLAKACKKVNEKKTIYEKELGVKLKVKRFNEGHVAVFNNARVNSREGYDSYQAKLNFSSRAVAKESANPGMQELTFTTELSVQYVLEP